MVKTGGNKGYYSSARGGFVSSTGRVYPTRNPSFVPSGHTSLTPSTGGVSVQGGKVTTVSPTGRKSTFVGNVKVPNTGMTATQISKQTRKEALSSGLVPSRDISRVSFGAALSAPALAPQTRQSVQYSSPDTSVQTFNIDPALLNAISQGTGLNTTTMNAPPKSSFWSRYFPDYSKRQGLPEGISETAFSIVPQGGSKPFEGKQSYAFVIESQAKTPEEILQEQQIVGELGSGVNRPNFFAMTSQQELSVLERKRDIETYVGDIFAAQRKQSEISQQFQANPQSFKEAVISGTKFAYDTKGNITGYQTEYSLPSSYFESLPEFKALEQFKGNFIPTKDTRITTTGEPLVGAYQFKGMGQEGLSSTKTWQSEYAKRFSTPSDYFAYTKSPTKALLSEGIRGFVETALVYPAEHPVKSLVVAGATFGTLGFGVPVGVTALEAAGVSGGTIAGIGSSAGFLATGVYAGTVAYNFKTAQTPYAKGGVLAETVTTELAPSLIGGYYGTKFGTYLTTPKYSFETRRGEFTQLNTGDTLKVYQTGQMGKDTYFTVKGKAVFEIPSETSYSIQPTPLQKMFGFKTQYGILDTPIYQIQTLGKNQFFIRPSTETPNVYGYYGGGLRTVKTTGYQPFVESKWSIGTTRFIETRTESFVGSGKMYSFAKADLAVQPASIFNFNLGVGKTFDFTQFFKGVTTTGTRYSFGGGEFKFTPKEITIGTKGYYTSGGGYTMSGKTYVPSSYQRYGVSSGFSKITQPSSTAYGYELNIQTKETPFNYKGKQGTMYSGETTSELTSGDIYGRTYFKTRTYVPEDTISSMDITKNYGYPDWVKVTKNPPVYKAGEFDYLAKGASPYAGSKSARIGGRKFEYSGGQGVLIQEVSRVFPSSQIFLPSSFSGVTIPKTQTTQTNLLSLSIPARARTNILMPQTELGDRLITTGEFKFVETTVPKTPVNFASISGQVSRQSTKTITTTTTVTTTPTVPISPPTFDFPPVSTVTPFPLLLKPFAGFSTGARSRKIKGKKRRGKYTPSYEALVFNIKGKQPKKITGLEVRPIPKGFTWAYNKLKF